MFDKLKQLSKDTLLYGISTVLGRFLVFFLVPFHTNIFPQAEYGIIGNVYAYFALMNIIYIYGMDAAYLKMASLPELKDKKDTFSTPFITIFLTGAFFSILIWLLKPEAAAIMKISGTYEGLVDYFALILLLDALTIIPFNFLRLQNRVIKFSVIRLINVSVNLGLNIILILGFDYGIEAVLIANAIASLVSFLLLTPDIIRNLYPSFDAELLKRFLKFGLPYLPAGLALVAMQVIDRPILEELTDKATLGVYTANYKLGIFMMLFVQMFQFAWQPFFLQHAQDEKAKEIFAKVLTYFTLVGSIILVVLSIFITDIAKLNIAGRSILGPDFWGGIHIIPIILLAYLFNGFYVNFIAGLYIKEKSTSVPIITGIGAVTNVVSNIILIPMLNITGAAISTLISYVVMATGLFIFSRKIYRVDYEFSKIGRIFLAVAIIGSIYYYLLNTDAMTFLIQIGLTLGFFILILIFGVIDKREFLKVKEILVSRRK